MLARLATVAVLAILSMSVPSAVSAAATIPPEPSATALVYTPPATTAAVLHPQPTAVFIRSHRAVWGDTLSALAARFCGAASLFPRLAANNHVRNPDLIYAGVTYRMDCRAGVQGTPARSAVRTVVPVQATSGWVHPLPGAVCVSGWGAPRGNHSHKGVDLPAPSGTRIRAVHAGVVSLSRWQSGAGWYVVVDHGRYDSVYMHLRSRSPLAVGTRVNAGSTVGRVGSTGHATGPHLHLEIHDGAWHPINPAPFLRARGVRVGC